MQLCKCNSAAIYNVSILSLLKSPRVSRFKSSKKEHMAGIDAVCHQLWSQLRWLHEAKSHFLLHLTNKLCFHSPNTLVKQEILHIFTSTIYIIILITLHHMYDNILCCEVWFLLVLLCSNIKGKEASEEFWP